MLMVNMNCVMGLERLMALTPSSPIRFPTMIESTTLPRHAERAIKIDDQRNLLNSVLNDMFLLILNELYTLKIACHTLTWVKESETYDGVNKAVDIVGSSSRPLEAKTIEYLGGIVVGRFYETNLS